MAKPIVNIADIALEPRPSAFTPTDTAAERYEVKRGFIAPLIGARKLGYNITVVPPGKRAFPQHNHHANKEMFFVLQGTGELRVGANTWPLRAGDVIACPQAAKKRRTRSPIPASRNRGTWP